MSRTARLLSCLWLLVWLSDLSFAVGAEQFTQAESEIVEWFDRLGFPDLSKAKLVRVSIGGFQFNDEPSVNQYVFAFLLNEHEDRFTVFTPTLVTLTYQKTPDGVAEHSKVAFELADLQKEAAAEIKRLNMPPKSDEDRWRRFAEKLSERAEVFVLARGCAAHGLHDLAHQLIAAAARMPGHTGQPTGMNGFKAALSKDIGHAMMWRAVEDFGEPEISRKELLAKFRHFLERFPDSEHVDRAKARRLGKRLAIIVE